MNWPRFENWSSRSKSLSFPDRFMSSNSFPGPRFLDTPSDTAAFLEELNAGRLRSYREDPGLLQEHFGIEQTVLAGGYGYRQILELVQNGADAILEAREHGVLPADDSRIHVLLRGHRLYVANTGAPLSREGLDALLRAHVSPKRGSQIGRFGLGFKSLLRFDGRIDVFTQKSGAISFDPRRCREDLKQRFNVSAAPALRLAWPLDGDDRASDTTCVDLAWAETIVRVEILTREVLEHLQHEITSFPAEFLLFFPVPTVLELDDGEHPARKLRIEYDGDEKVLHYGEEISRWRVALRDLHINDQSALLDATHIHRRNSVPLAWAVPLEGRREEAGRFWAFFPTHTATYIPGILNAPWKLSSDRNAIISGEWNDVLMSSAASLVADTLPALSTPSDPARSLDAFPRQLERKDEDAASLVAGLWKALETVAVVPDGRGILRAGRDLWRHPRDSAHLARLWQALAGSEAATQFVDASCLERQRSSRLNALAERLELAGIIAPAALQRCEVASWFSKVASSDPAQAIRVLELAEAYANECKPGEWNAVRPRLAIIPSQAGELLTEPRAVLAPDGTTVPGRSAVLSALYNDSNARRILADVMKVQTPTDSVWEQVLGESMRSIPHYPPEARDGGWRTFWANLRQAPPRVQEQFVNQRRDEIRVRRRDLNWVMASDSLLPGVLIEAHDSSANQNLLVDEAVHGEDGAMLAALGVCQIPEGQLGPGPYARIDRGVALSEWLEACRTTYKDTHANPALPSYLEPFSFTMPKGFAFLPRLRGRPNARLTKQFLSQIGQGSFSGLIEFGHRTMQAYPKIYVPHPALWLVLRHGSVEIGNVPVEIAALLARRNERALSTLEQWPEWSNWLEKLDHAFPKVQPSAEAIRNMWQALVHLLVTTQMTAEDSLGDLWAGAARDGIVPEALPSPRGPVMLADILVSGSPDLARRARTPERIIVTLDEPTRELWLAKGARDLSRLINPEWVAGVGPETLLVSVIPELNEFLRADLSRVARCQGVSGLTLKVDRAPHSVPCLMWEGTLLLDTNQLEIRSRTERMRLIVSEIASAGWLNCAPEEALQRLGNARVDALRLHVAEGATLGERLLRAVGDRREPLLQALGTLGDMEFVMRCTPLQLAELALAQLGPATLTELKDTLNAEGLNPPRRWNTSEARGFVASIGFPVEFASSPESKREPEEIISGPIELPPLHDFQQEVMHGIGALIASGTKRRRAVVSLPTGGGKTRVSVEAAVRLVLGPEGGCRSVVWIAQTDELCEQAVQAFRHVWMNLGAQRTDLRIVRLWGGHINPAIQELDRPVVVVASIQTLNSRIGADGLAWLRRPGLVVVDECHHAITPSYSNLLRWLDAEAPRPGAAGKDEPPIIGLSATPFRTDDDESQRLAKRFDNRWLPADQEALHARLRAQGVLAQAAYEGLQSGARLLDEEIERLTRLREWEGLDFENLLESINRRLAGDMRRNERLVDHIRQSAERSILFFTNSVQHAEEMSARLNLDGVAAAAVSGNTPSVARRYFLDRFQRGEIRVLCNHSVLSTGFDAPKTDMVLIARQVFSSVRYMQMVGRGLRGVRNGGTARCRIVTVVDNLGRFEDRHPYHYCRQYFSAIEGVTSI